jgi:ankyrin repeat protein
MMWSRNKYLFAILFIIFCVIHINSICSSNSISKDQDRIRRKAKLQIEDFFRAVKARDVKKVRHHLENGMDVNMKMLAKDRIYNQENETAPILYAIENDDIRMLKLLVDFGADVNINVIKTRIIHILRYSLQ